MSALAHPIKALFLAATALALLGSAYGAQSQSKKIFARYNKPLKSVTLDLATGTITRGGIASNRGATTCVNFDNNDLSGFVGVDTGNGFCEWFDAGVTGNGNCIDASDLLTSITFAYCSAMLSAQSGGPGGSVRLGLYEGYTVFGGAPTTTVAAFTLNGLPANTASSSFFGGFRCFFTKVEFDPIIHFQDGPFGWSWRFIDVGADGILAGTWPFLSCVVSCSGAILQVDGQGMTDVIDEYCPPGSLLSTFTFGTTSGSFTSLSWQKTTKVAVEATITPKDSVPSNPDKLTCSKAIIGETWRSTVTTGVVRTAGITQWWFSSSCLAFPVVVPQSFGGLDWGTSKGGRVLICNLQNQIGLVAHGAVSPPQSLGSLSLDVPLDCDLVGAQFCIQATVTGRVLGSPPQPPLHIRLTDACSGTIGTE